MSYNAPTLHKIVAPTTAKCGHCLKVLRVGDTILEYVSSTYRGNTNWRKIHFQCLIEKSKLGLGDVLNITKVLSEVTA